MVEDDQGLFHDGVSMRSAWRWRRIGISVVCAMSLMSIAVGTSTAGAMRPHDAGTNYGCRDRFIGRQIFPVAVTGNTPTSIEIPESQVSMTDVQAAITIPGSALEKPIKKGAITLTATVNVLDINASDARVKTMNVAKTPITVGPIALVSGQSLVLKIPPSPTSTGIWGAKNTGTMTFTTGKVTIVLDFGSPGSTTAQCTPKPAAVISTTEVT
jgi:hypothetical protein